MDALTGDTPAEASYHEAKASKFTFKSKSGRSSKRHRGVKDEEDDSINVGESSTKRHRTHRDEKDHRRRHHRSRHDEHKRKHTSATAEQDRHSTSTRDGAYYDPNFRYRESLFDGLDDRATAPELATDEAFRESLFDALADDEGAAYWEGVYGQPVHVYPDTKPGPDGKLERMTEDEYADYVRMKMWEKSHQHIVEEREAKEKARQERKRQQQHMSQDMFDEEKEREHIRQQMAESLKRGAERKKAKEAAAAWERYTKKWEEIKNQENASQHAKTKLQELIPWPVLSGRVEHVCKEDIELFLRASPLWRTDPIALLKVERVRWHPDKLQHRFGQHISPDMMKSVTAVFQIIDRIWNERR